MNFFMGVSLLTLSDYREAVPQLDSGLQLLKDLLSLLIVEGISYKFVFHFINKVLGSQLHVTLLMDGNRHGYILLCLIIILRFCEWISFDLNFQ